jgi:hypothetical protein
LEWEKVMNEDTFNMQLRKFLKKVGITSLRKFLKKVGITSQREVEQAVRQALDSGTIRGDESLQASVVLKVPQIGLEMTITDAISLE